MSPDGASASGLSARVYLMAAPSGGWMGGFAPADLEQLRARFPMVEVRQDDDPLDDLDAVLVWHLDAARLEACLRASPRLRWVHIVYAGVPPRVLRLLEGHPAILTNGSGAHAPAIAEFVALALLAHYRRLDDMHAHQASRTWPRHFDAPGLAGRTIGIFGLGDLGRAIASVLRPFGVRLLGVRRGFGPVEEVDEVLPRERLTEFLARLDALVVAAPLTAETRGLLDAAMLAHLPRGAYVVNVGRGAIFDEAALVEALRSGHLGGAALDVFEREPLAPESPLWDLPGVRISPHASDHIPLTQRRSLDLLLDNLGRFVAGQPLRNVVDRALGY